MPGTRPDATKCASSISRARCLWRLSSTFVTYRYVLFDYRVLQH